MPAMTPRPTERHPEIVRAACEEILPGVMDWLGSGHAEADVLGDLVRSADPDAFRFARNLETDHGWDGDYDLVEVLDCYSAYRARTEAVKTWVRHHRIEVPFAPGDRVTAHGEACEVAEIRSETAEIVARPVHDATGRFANGGGYIVAAEKLTKEDA